MIYHLRAALLFLLVVLPFALQLSAATTFVTIGTGGLTGVYYPTGGAIAKIVNKNRKQHGVRCTVESTDGSVFNVDAVMDGQFEFGIVQSDRQYQAVHGIGDWKNKGPQKELRAVFSIYAESCSLLVAVDANINSLIDLKGKRVNLGNQGSGHLGNSLDVLKTIGLDPRNEIESYYINPVEAPRLLQDGKLDAFFYTVGHPSVALKEAISGSRKVRFLPIQNGGIDALVASLPYYSKMEIPVKYYSGVQNERNVASFGVCATLVTSTRVSDKVVYGVVRSIFENLGSFKALHPAYSMTTRKSMLKCLSAPIHPGAMKYFKEAKLK